MMLRFFLTTVVGLYIAAFTLLPVILEQDAQDRAGRILDVYEKASPEERLLLHARLVGKYCRSLPASHVAIWVTVSMLAGIIFAPYLLPSECP